MRVIAFPKSGIAYNDCFYNALETEGVTVVEGVFSGGWLISNLRTGDWVHFHWPSFAYNVEGTRLRLVLWFVRFLALLLISRAKGARIVWTAHNLLPHDRCTLPFLDVFGRHFLIALSHMVLVHGPGPADALGARFPNTRSKMVSIPHGNWIGYYPVTVTQVEARLAFGIPEDKLVFLFIGLCKPYKNLDKLVSVFRSSSQNANLIVAGKFPDSDYRDQIHQLAGDDHRIRIDEGFIPDERMQHYLMACDFVVVPYREILTSGTAMLALSFGRPVISVDFGFLRDVITSEAGILFPHTDPDGLAKALASAGETLFDEAIIVAHARKFTYSDAARIFSDSMKASGSVSNCPP